MTKRIIYKYELPILITATTKPFTCNIQTYLTNSKVLFVGVQGDKGYVWIEGDDNKPTTKRIADTKKFLVVWTGRSFQVNPKQKKTFLGTVDDYTGLVYHIFELR